MKMKSLLFAFSLAGALAEHAAATDPLITTEFGVTPYVGVGVNLPVFEPRIAFDGNNYLVVWLDGRDLPQYSIYGARVRPDGTVLDPSGILICRSSSRLVQPSVAGNASGFFVAWTDDRGTSDDIYGTLIASDGEAVTPNGFPITTADNSQASPAVAANGTGFLVVWEHTVDSFVYPGQSPNKQI